MAGPRDGRPDRPLWPSRARGSLVVALILGFAACAGGGGRSAGSDVRADKERPQKASKPVVRWERDELGMSDSFLPSGGRLLAGDGEAVYVASGFGAPAIDVENTVTALDRTSGETRWTVTRAGPVFLQGVAGSVVVANEQFDLIVGLDAATGQQQWVADLPTVGLGGYGANVSAMTDALVIVGVSARTEGDTRPPVIVALDPSTGSVVWQATLDAGTDLNFGAPALVDGAIVFLSTLSHPESAPGNIAHAVNLADGSIRWSVPLGGSQGFHAFGAAVSAAGVHLPGQTTVTTVDPTTGAIQWERDGAFARPVTVGDQLWVLEADRIVVVDAHTGQELSSITKDMNEGDAGLPLIPTQRGDLVLLFSRTGARAVDVTQHTTRWSTNWPRAAVDVPLATDDLLTVATGDRGITTFDLPQN
jgi:outer membrane protein assembly factor BamB